MLSALARRTIYLGWDTYEFASRYLFNPFIISRGIALLTSCASVRGPEENLNTNWDPWKLLKVKDVEVKAGIREYWQTKEGAGIVAEKASASRRARTQVVRGFITLKVWTRMSAI